MKAPKCGSSRHKWLLPKIALGHPTSVSVWLSLERQLSRGSQIVPPPPPQKKRKQAWFRVKGQGLWGLEGLGFICLAFRMHDVSVELIYLLAGVGVQDPCQRKSSGKVRFVRCLSTHHSPKAGKPQTGFEDLRCSARCSPWFSLESGLGWRKLGVSIHRAFEHRLAKIAALEEKTKHTSSVGFLLGTSKWLCTRPSSPAFPFNSLDK